ncbi:hypothetical protein TWF481_005950 [Arthrobotrys musiformis]|uniref:Uncharacterized protein n=1 Tax=Arthrobotrys musiformis TaxID=47236 RepID=A0AAV9WHA9_9PEZI
MFILKSLVAALALGLVQETIAAAAAPACCTNKCGKPVQLAKNGKKDCSAFLIKTVIPTRTTTLFKTTTLARTTTVSKTTTLAKSSTAIKKVTDTTDITVTTVISETDYSTSTSLATTEETATVTDTTTTVETLYETTTVPYPVETVSITLKKRSAKPTKPSYASACDNGAYTRACSCLGIKPKTTTRSAVVKTVYKTRTAYKTVTAYKTFTAYKTNTVTHTSKANTETRTHSVSLSTYTTIISGTAITATETVTLTEPATLTETTVSVATQTADPVPPTCAGKGFALYIRDSTNANGWGAGTINSIGEGIYVRLWSNGAAPMAIDDNGNLQSWYGSTFQYKIKAADILPAKVWIQYIPAGVSYTWASVDLTCGIGGAPDYELTCKSATETYLTTFCRENGEYRLTVYTDVSQLNGWVCTNDGKSKATCIL